MRRFLVLVVTILFALSTATLAHAAGKGKAQGQAAVHASTSAQAGTSQTGTNQSGNTQTSLTSPSKGGNTINGSVKSCMNGSTGPQCKNPVATHCNANNPQGFGCPKSGAAGPVCGNGKHVGNPHCATGVTAGQTTKSSTTASTTSASTTSASHGNSTSSATTSAGQTSSSNLTSQGTAAATTGTTSQSTVSAGTVPAGATVLGQVQMGNGTTKTTFQTPNGVVHTIYTPNSAMPAASPHVLGAFGSNNTRAGAAGVAGVAGVTMMPRTGGGQTPGLPELPIVLSLLLLGAGVMTKSYAAVRS